MGFKYFENFLSFFFLKVKKTLKIKGLSFSDYPAVEFGILFYEKYSQKNVKSETTKLPAGVRNIKPSQAFLSVANW